MVGNESPNSSLFIFYSFFYLININIAIFSTAALLSSSHTIIHIHYFLLHILCPFIQVFPLFVTENEQGKAVEEALMQNLEVFFIILSVKYRSKKSKWQKIQKWRKEPILKIAHFPNKMNKSIISFMMRLMVIRIKQSNSRFSWSYFNKYLWYLFAIWLSPKPSRP